MLNLNHANNSYFFEVCVPAKRANDINPFACESMHLQGTKTKLGAKSSDFLRMLSFSSRNRAPLLLGALDYHQGDLENGL